MLINTYPVNINSINGPLTQAPTTLLSIEKTIELRITFEGSLLDIEKNIVTSQVTTTLLSIEKYIQDIVASTFYTRNGWEPFITLGPYTITAAELTGAITVVKQEDDNHTAEFSLILYPDVYDLYSFQGQDVTISVHKNGVVRRIFTGEVDVPVVDVIGEKLTLQCVADRRVLIGDIGYYEPYIGYYSATVLGQNSGTYNRIQARLSTIPASLDFDSYNNFTVNSWSPSSASFTYGSSSVYRRDPQLTLESSGKIINQINLSLDYGYQRHHHRQASYSWIHPYAPANRETGEGGICPFLEDRPSMPTREMILGAIDSTGWPVIPVSIHFGKQFKSGSFRCNGVWVQWSTVETSTYTGAILNNNGTPSTDPSGNPLYRTEVRQVSDNTNVFAMAAQWVSTTRFNQNVKESYTAVVSAPTSITRYGTLDSAEAYALTANDIYTGWEDYKGFSSPPSGVTTYTDPTSGSYFFNGNTDRGTFNNAYICALNKAKTTILKSHRDTRITFQMDLTPDMELKHTIELTGKWIRGKGKANRIAHIMSISDSTYGSAGECYTEVSLLQYRENTTISDTPLVTPAAVADTTVTVQSGANLQTHLGLDPSGVGSEFWTGYVGNIQILVPGAFGGTNHTRSTYQESFIVDVPDVDPDLRQDRILVRSNAFSVNIPNDDTVYESYG